MLQREPRNDYDQRAIAVCTRAGAKLGYLPRVDNHALSNLMDAQFEVTARIRSVAPDPRQPDILLEVFLAVQPPAGPPWCRARTSKVLLPQLGHLGIL